MIDDKQQEKTAVQAAMFCKKQGVVTEEWRGGD